MRKSLTVISILLVLLVSACSAKPVATTVVSTQALPAHTTAPATTEPTKAATSAVGSPAATSSAGGTPSGTGTPAASNSTPAASAGTPQIPVTGLAAKVSVANIPALGSVLVDNTGMPLYMSKSDKQNGTTSACDLTCIQTWVPLITISAPVAGEGADASMLGTITLKSGLLQVTYNGWPLYHYLPDASLPANQRGQASGQGFQGRFVMGPDGNPVSTLLPTAAGTATP